MDFEKFSEILISNDIENILMAEDRIAVGVSGGVDSMALAKLLGEWFTLGHDKKVYAITVDHCLRRESADEALFVSDFSKSFKNVVHTTLGWLSPKPESGIMEAAREARYELMADFCKKNNIRYLCLAHHMDDQAETVLNRVVSGSSVSGLCGMRYIQSYDKNLTIVRPFLEVPKQELYDFCEKENIPWVEDPTNKKTQYMRGRLRGVWDVLENEGLTSKRLSRLSVRMQKVESALSFYEDELFESSVIENGVEGVEGCLRFDLAKLLSAPELVRVRVVLSAISMVFGGGERSYGPRLHRVEELLSDMWRRETGTSVTIGGCILKIAPGQGVFEVRREG